MSRSVIMPTSFSSSVIGSEPMCSSRISRAASSTGADAPIERGFSVIASRTLFAIAPPLVFSSMLARGAWDGSTSILGVPEEPGVDVVTGREIVGPSPGIVVGSWINGQSHVCGRWVLARFQLRDRLCDEPRRDDLVGVAVEGPHRDAGERASRYGKG